MYLSRKHALSLSKFHFFFSIELHIYNLCLLLFDHSLQIVIKSSLEQLTDLSILICPQHDAACHVIARLKKERDEAWSSLAQSERQIMPTTLIAITSCATLSSGKRCSFSS